MTEKNKKGVVFIINTTRIIRIWLLVLGIVLILAACSDNEENADPNNNDSSDNEASGEASTITVGLDPYDYSTVPAYLSQVILEQEGLNVDIQKAEVGILYQALADKEIDAYIDVSRPRLHESYLEEFDDQFETAGKLYTDLPLGMAVPEYMEDINSIEDVKSNPELFDNTLYAIEPGSGMGETTERMVEDYDLTSFEINNSSTQALLGQIKKSTEKEEPIVFNAWRPNPMFINYDIKFLDDPLESWNFDDVEVGVTPELKDESPVSYTLFSNMSLDLDMIEEWIVSIDEGKEPRDLAETWVENNQGTVDEWLDK